MKKRPHQKALGGRPKGALDLKPVGSESVAQNVSDAFAQLEGPSQASAGVPGYALSPR